MKKSVMLFLCLFPLLLASCSTSTSVPETTACETISATIPATSEIPPHPTSEPENVPTVPEPVLELTEEEKNMLLKIGMAERGSEDCTTCIALVMRTVLNRVGSDRFGSSIRSVIFAPEQFTPVADGTYHCAEPNQHCHEALEMVIHGWDESQGALFYEWCEGESWHSKNLHLLFQHCNVRFYE